MERSTKEQQQKEVIASLEQSGLKMVPYSLSRGQLTGTGQSYVDYPKLNFTPENLFAVGSPIALFLTVRCVVCGRRCVVGGVGCVVGGVCGVWCVVCGRRCVVCGAVFPTDSTCHLHAHSSSLNHLPFAVLVLIVQRC